MRKFVTCLCLLPLAAAAWGQTKFNPATQINWPLVTGSGAPAASSCTFASYGQPYTDVLNNRSYVCGGSGWIQGGGTVGGTASPNQIVAFTLARSAALTVAAATKSVTWACWDAASPANSIQPSGVSVSPSTYQVVFSFAVPQSGYCVVNSTGSGSYTNAESGATWTIPAATHLMGAAVMVQTFDQAGNRIYGNVAVNSSGDVTINWLTSQTGKVVIAP